MLLQNVKDISYMNLLSKQTTFLLSTLNMLSKNTKVLSYYEFMVEINYIFIEHFPVFFNTI